VALQNLTRVAVKLDVEPTETHCTCGWTHVEACNSTPKLHTSVLLKIPRTGLHSNSFQTFPQGWRKREREREAERQYFSSV